CCHGIGALPSGTLIKPPEPKMTRARSSPDAYQDTVKATLLVGSMKQRANSYGN
ncbi:hypothetical protein ABIC09_002323, partial [Bradyrhizobium sp. S3.12.5]